EPVSSGVLTPQLAVEDCGREVYADGRALHAFRVYNKAMPDQGGKVATTSAGAAQKWISAIEESIKESETGGKPEKASVGERTLTRLVSIGQGLGDIFTREMQADVDVGGDAIETTKWRIFKVADGLRFFHEASEEGFESLIKAEGVVEASADSIFEVLMSTSAPLSMQWDTFTVENEVVEAVDGHTDIIFAIVTNRQYTHGRPLEKEVLASRTWRRNHDGSYGITTFNTLHDSKPPNARRPRLDFACKHCPCIACNRGFPNIGVMGHLPAHPIPPLPSPSFPFRPLSSPSPLSFQPVGSWDILPLTPARPKTDHVQCLVRPKPLILTHPIPPPPPSLSLPFFQPVGSWDILPLTPARPKACPPPFPFTLPSLIYSFHTPSSLPLFSPFLQPVGSWDILPLTPARPKSGHVKCLVRHVIELGTAPSLSSSPSSRYTDSPTPPTPSKRSVSPSPSAFASQSVSSPVHSALPRPAQAVAGVAKAAAGRPISFIKGLMREKKEKELPKLASVAVGGGVGGAGGVGGGGLVEVEEEADGHVAFEEFADSFPYASLCRIAGLREYFAAQPAMEEHVERNTEEVVASLMERTESLEDQFFDAEGEEAEPAKEKVSAKARWQGLKWMVQFGFRLRSLFLVEEEEADKERWEVRRELQVDATPTDLLAVGEKLRAQASLPLGVDPKDAHAWKQAVSDNFCVRGATYLSDGIKIPAAQPLLSLLAVDWFKSDSRIDNVAARPGSVMQSEAGKKLPFVFVLNLQVPGKPNYSCVAYFAADRPVKKDSLLGRFVNAEDDSFRNSRFKLIPRIEEGFWAVKRAVGTKAAILGKALTCSYFKGENYLEMDVDVGSSSVARSVIGLVLSYVTSLVVDLALLIEAQAADELPEYLLGTITLMRLEPKKAIDPPPA
ncbi:unnamed protein product, partial [Closterium sp. NIES-65]